jgi:hypothetical protein
MCSACRCGAMPWAGVFGAVLHSLLLTGTRQVRVAGALFYSWLLTLLLPACLPALPCPVCPVQEIKLQEEHCADVLKDLQLPPGWHASWNCSRDKKGAWVGTWECHPKTPETPAYSKGCIISRTRKCPCFPAAVPRPAPP